MANNGDVWILRTAHKGSVATVSSSVYTGISRKNKEFRNVEEVWTTLLQESPSIGPTAEHVHTGHSNSIVSA